MQSTLLLSLRCGTRPLATHAPFLSLLPVMVLPPMASHYYRARMEGARNPMILQLATLTLHPYSTHPVYKATAKPSYFPFPFAQAHYRRLQSTVPEPNPRCRCLSELCHTSPRL